VSRTWMLLRRPLLLALVLGWTVSLLVSGRVVLRLVVDGALGFAFVPAFEVAAFAVVYHRVSSPRRMAFAAAVDRLFATNAPWVVALAALAALAVTRTPQEVLLWNLPPRQWVLLSAAAIAGGWSAYVEHQFLRTALGRTNRDAIGDAVLLRAIAWPLATVYFFGFAAWPLVVQWSRGL
jgi:hypothetical protein